MMMMMMKQAKVYDSSILTKVLMMMKKQTKVYDHVETSSHVVKKRKMRVNDSLLNVLIISNTYIEIMQVQSLSLHLLSIIVR